MEKKGIGKCYECKNDDRFIIQIGEDPDWESATTYVCGDCLHKALELLTQYS